MSYKPIPVQEYERNVTEMICKKYGIEDYKCVPRHDLERKTVCGQDFYKYEVSFMKDGRKHHFLIEPAIQVYKALGVFGKDLAFYDQDRMGKEIESVLEKHNCLLDQY